MHTLSWWDPTPRHDENEHCDECSSSCAAVRCEVHVLFHSQDLLVCSRECHPVNIVLLLPFWQAFPMTAPYLLPALPQTASQRHKKIQLFHFRHHILHGPLFGWWWPAQPQTSQSEDHHDAQVGIWTWLAKLQSSRLIIADVFAIVSKTRPRPAPGTSVMVRTNPFIG